MNKKGNVLIVLTLTFSILGIAAYLVYNIFFTNKNLDQSTVKPPTASPTSEEQSDLPPLYPGVKWEKTMEGKDFLFINKNHEAVVSYGFRYETETLSYEPQDIIMYFDKELLSRSWVETEVAGGPDGEVFDYQKGSKYFTVQYQALSEEKGPDRKITGYKVIIDHN